MYFFNLILSEKQWIFLECSVIMMLLGTFFGSKTMKRWSPSPKDQGQGSKLLMLHFTPPRGTSSWVPFLTFFLSFPNGPGHILHFPTYFTEGNLVCLQTYLMCSFYSCVSLGMPFFISHATIFFPCQAWASKIFFQPDYEKLS